MVAEGWDQRLEKGKILWLYLCVGLRSESYPDMYDGFLAPHLTLNPPLAPALAPNSFFAG